MDWRANPSHTHTSAESPQGSTNYYLFAIDGDSTGAAALTGAQTNLIVEGKKCKRDGFDGAQTWTEARGSGSDL
jgi:hypothetical protein